MSYYTFGDELTPLGINSLYFPEQMDVVYKKQKITVHSKKSQLRILF